MTTKKTEIEKIIEHPLEGVFDIEENTTLVPSVERETELVVKEEYDDKDKEVETQYQEIYDLALTAFENTSDTVETIDPKYKARNEEIAVQYLNTALSAAKEKGALKKHKDKLDVSKQSTKTPGTVNQNVIVADRNELLKRLLGNDGD